MACEISNPRAKGLFITVLTSLAVVMQEGQMVYPAVVMRYAPELCQRIKYELV